MPQGLNNIMHSVSFLNKIHSSCILFTGVCSGQLSETHKEVDSLFFPTPHSVTAHCNLKSSVMGVFTPEKTESATHQPSPHPSHY